MIMGRNKDKAMAQQQGNFITNILGSSFVLKVLNSRASQFISAIAGFLVGQVIASGFLEKIQGNEALVQFLTDVGIAPTEAGITGLLTGIFWGVYNLVMTLMYGAKFKEIQQAHGLDTDRWAGPITMAAAKHIEGGK